MNGSANKGLVINASGNKKNPSRDYNKVKASLSHTSRMKIDFNQTKHVKITNEDLTNKPFPIKLEPSSRRNKERTHKSNYL